MKKNDIKSRVCVCVCTCLRVSFSFPESPIGAPRDPVFVHAAQLFNPRLASPLVFEEPCSPLRLVRRRERVCALRVNGSKLPPPSLSPCNPLLQGPIAGHTLLREKLSNLDSLETTETIPSIELERELALFLLLHPSQLEFEFFVHSFHCLTQCNSSLN